MSDNATYGGPSTFTIVQLTFVVLKLTKVIDWSWWWVMAPTWIPVGLLLVIGLGFLILQGSKLRRIKRRFK